MGYIISLESNKSQIYIFLRVQWYYGKKADKNQIIWLVYSVSFERNDNKIFEWGSILDWTSIRVQRFIWTAYSVRLNRNKSSNEHLHRVQCYLKGIKHKYLFESGYSVSLEMKTSIKRKDYLNAVQYWFQETCE